MVIKEEDKGQAALWDREDYATEFEQQLNEKQV